MTPEDREALRRLDDAATSGPWQTRFMYRALQAARKDPSLLMNAPGKDWANAELIVAMRNALPSLLEAADALETAQRKLEAVTRYEDERYKAVADADKRFREELAKRESAEAALAALQAQVQQLPSPIKVGSNSIASPCPVGRTVCFWCNENWPTETAFGLKPVNHPANGCLAVERQSWPRPQETQG